MSRFGLFLCKKAGKYNKPRKSYSKYRLWRRAAAVMMILSLTAGLAACGLAGEGSQAAAKDTWVQRYAWPLGSSSPEDTVTQIYAEKFADEVDRLSDGKMKISVYPNSVLGGDRELLESCKDGDIPFVVQNTALHYNLDMVIALGYRVQSQVATRFRRWATQRLHEYIQKGFAMDDERLKQGGNRYFRELLQRIRDIRSSERNFYQQVTDIYATATDYDPRDEMTKMFFATVQNKLHYAVHENTAAEVIYNRVDNEKPFVGMTNFKGNYVTKDDVKIAKNYLSEIELQRLNLLVSGFLDFAEFQALEMNPMTMKDWIEALDNQIIAHKRKVLIGKGNISHKQAVEKAEKEFEIYRKREMELLESDFDKEIKKLKDRNDSSSK